MGSLSMVHWVAVLLVVVLVFGTKKLGSIGADLGKAVKGFKDGVKGEEGHPADEAGLTNHLAESTPVHVIGVNETRARVAVNEKA